jgi:hypothetical protein
MLNTRTPWSKKLRTAHYFAAAINSYTTELLRR